MKPFREMNKQELLSMIDLLEQEREHTQYPSQLEIIESKIITAQSYLVDPSTYLPGKYHITGQQKLMQLAYVNGIMAWGSVEGVEVCFPLSLLSRDDS